MTLIKGTLDLVVSFTQTSAVRFIASPCAYVYLYLAYCHGCLVGGSPTEHNLCRFFRIMPEEAKKITDSLGIALPRMCMHIHCMYMYEDHCAPTLFRHLL